MQLLLWLRKGWRHEPDALKAEAVAPDTGAGESPRFRHPEWDSPPAYVVVPTLPDNVAYQIVRNPDSATPRVIVFSESTITDERLYSSVGWLAVDEQRVPESHSVRTITRFTDGWYEVEVEGQVSRQQVFRGARTDDDAVPFRGPDSERILRATAIGKEIEVRPGIRGRLFKPVR